MNKLVLTLSALALATLSAHASTVVGNPATTVVLDVGSYAYVDYVRAYTCRGHAEQIDLQTTLSSSEPSVGLNLPTDTYCSVVVRMKWSAGDPLETVTVQGFDVLDVDSAFATVAIELDASTEEAWLE